MRHSLQKRPPPSPCAPNCSNPKIFYEGLKSSLTSLVLNAVGPFSISQNSRLHIAAIIEKNCEKIAKKFYSCCF